MTSHDKSHESFQKQWTDTLPSSLHLLLRQHLYPFPFLSDHHFDPPNPLLEATYSIRSRGKPLASLWPGVLGVMFMGCQLFHPKQTTLMLILLFNQSYYLLSSHCEVSTWKGHKCGFTSMSRPYLMCIFIIVTRAKIETRKGHEGEGLGGISWRW